MSVIWSNEEGWLLCHSQYLHKVYRDLEQTAEFCPSCRAHRIFHIQTPYLKYGQKANQCVIFKLDKILPSSVTSELGDYSKENFKSEEVTILPQMFENFMRQFVVQKPDYFVSKCGEYSNSIAIESAKEILRISEGKLSTNYHGGNLNCKATSVTLENDTYFIPPNCKFYNCDVTKMKDKFEHHSQIYDFILIDPPWQNKHVKRKNANSRYQGYNLLNVDDFAQLPISDYLSSDGLVAVWCTNSSQQIKDLISKVFPVWNIRYICTWYWIKVTQNGQLICEFSTQENRKQPFERIVFGSRIHSLREYRNPRANKIIVSIPSSIHSHKPPLTEIMKEYLPPDCRCIELFARYLLPDWTSCGDEVLKLQHHLLFR